MKKGILYCGFETVDQLIKDHKAIKKQIKRWEKRIDRIVFQECSAPSRIPLSKSQLETLEEMSHEMCAINI